MGSHYAYDKEKYSLLDAPSEKEQNGIESTDETVRLLLKCLDFATLGELGCDQEDVERLRRAEYVDAFAAEGGSIVYRITPKGVEALQRDYLS